MAIQRRRQQTNRPIHHGLFSIARRLQQFSHCACTRRLISRPPFPYLSRVPTFHPRISTKNLEPSPGSFREYVQNKEEDEQAVNQQDLTTDKIMYLVTVLRCDTLSIASHLMEIFFAVISPNSSIRPSLLTGNALKMRFLRNADQIINSVKAKYANFDHYIQSIEMEEKSRNEIKNVAANFVSMIQYEAYIFKRGVFDIIDEEFAHKLTGTSGKCTMLFARRMYKFFLDGIVDSENCLFIKMSNLSGL